MGNKPETMDHKFQLKLFEEDEKDVFMLSSKTAAKYQINDPQTLRSQKVLILIFQQLQKKEKRKKENNEPFDYTIRIPYAFFDKFISAEWNTNNRHYWAEIASKAVSISAVLPKIDENGMQVDSYMPVFQRIDHGYEARYIEIMLNKEFIPHYSKLTSNYVQTKLSEIKNFKSKYSLRIYEYLIASSPSDKMLNVKMDLPYFVRHFNIPSKYAYPSRIDPLVLKPTTLDLQSTARFKNIKIILQKNSMNEYGKSITMIYFKQGKTKLEEELYEYNTEEFELDL